MHCTRLIALFLVLLASAHAETLPYEFRQLDIFLPGTSVPLGGLVDINDRGVIVTNAVSTYYQVVIARPGGDGQFKTSTFKCNELPNTGAFASSINNKEQIVGSCSNGTKGLGFVRDRNGSHILLDFPGAHHTSARGINDRGHVVGEYYNPLIPGQSGLFGIHGFLWDGAQYSTLDFPLPNTYTFLQSINRSGQILGEYYTFDPLMPSDKSWTPATNQLLAHHWFIYDNGNFITDFPESLNYIGGPSIYLSDMNDNGQIVGQRHNGGPNWDGLFLYDHGTFYDIEVPEGWRLYASGMNNEGQFVGTYVIDGRPAYESHGFIATPSPRLRISQR